MVEAVSLSHLNKVVIGHDGEGYGAGMYLKMVTVRETQDSDKEWVFPWWNWLDTHVGLCETLCEIVTVGKLSCNTGLHVYICGVFFLNLATALSDICSIFFYQKYESSVGAYYYSKITSGKVKVNKIPSCQCVVYRTPTFQIKFSTLQ